MRSYAMIPITLCILLSCLCSSVAFGQVVVAPQPGNQVSVNVSYTVSLDSSTGLYTYSYAVTNAASSAQEVWFFAIDLSGDAAQLVSNSSSPQGWQFMKHSGQPIVTWAATEVDTIPSNFVDDGSVLPSPYQIQPGQTLGGFSFQSPRPPTTVKFFAQGFTQVPQAVDAGDLFEAGYTVKDFTEDSIVGVAQGPSPSSSTTQPSGLGFFDFTNLINEAVVKPPVSVGVQFNTSAGTINTSSFHAILNGRDVTSAFTPVPNGTDLNATFNEATSPLVDGENLLQAVVSGTPLGGTINQFDFNTVRFYVNTSRPLDVNGDGVINCLDLGIVKASFGKKAGQPGFDPRADVNGDGLVNILDLSAVAKQLPAGTTCP